MKNSDAHNRRKKKRKTTTTAVDLLVIRDTTAANAAAVGTASPRPTQAPLDWTPVHPSSMSARTLISQDIWSARMSMMRSRYQRSNWRPSPAVFGIPSPLLPNIPQKDTSPHGKVRRVQETQRKKKKYWINHGGEILS